MDWNLATCQSSIPASELPELHKKAVDLINLLQQNLPDKTDKNIWNPNNYYTWYIHGIYHGYTMDIPSAGIHGYTMYIEM